MEYTMPTKTALTKLQKQLGPDRAIAVHYGVSSSTIRKWRKTLGIPSIYFKNEKRNVDIVRKHKRGWSKKRLATKFQLSESQIYRIIRRG